MSRQKLSYQTPALSSEYFLEEPSHLKTNAMAAMTASSLLLHIVAMVGMVLWIPNIELNLTPPPPVVSFTLAPPPPPPPPVVEQPVEPVVEPKDVITTAAEEAFHAVPEKPEPIPEPEPVKKPEPMPIPEPIIEPDPIVEPEPLPEPIPVIEEIPIPEEILEVIEPAVEPMPVVNFPVDAPVADEVPEVDEAAIRDAYIQQKTIDVFNMVDSNVKYPPLAKKRNIQGTVGLAIRYDSFGFFDSVTIETSSGSAILDKAAQKAAEKALKKSKDLTLSDETLFINVEYRLI